MGKKTIGKKGHEKEKSKNKKQGTLEDVSHGENKLPMIVEDGVKLRGKDEKKNNKVHESSANDMEINATRHEDAAEVDVSAKKKKKTKRNEKNGDSVELTGKSGITESKVATENDIDGDKEKKKRKKHEISGDDVDYDGRQSDAVVEGNVNRGKRNKSEGVIKGNVPLDMKTKRHKVTSNEGDSNNKENALDSEKKDKKKKRKLEGGEDETESRKAKRQKKELVENDGNKDKKKKAKSLKDGKDRGDKSMAGSKKGVDSKKKERSKKVSFSDQVEVFPSSSESQKAEKTGDNLLIRGKWFSKEEDEIVRKAVSNYIEYRKLGEDGLNMILHCRSHKEVKNCWKEIGAAIPWRPFVSVYYRAHILFERDENRNWTHEELEYVRKFHEKNGPDWRRLAKELGKHRIHVKDAWRRIKLANTNKGPWSQEEYQTLFDLVNMDLRLKAFEKKESKHGMLRDNIAWEAISDKLATRSYAICCQQWYYKLASPLVAEGKWTNSDDYKLVNALFSLDACCVEDVDWDNLLEHRDGSVCKKRWNQMVKHLGQYSVKPFAEQVEILSKRYCPDVLEAREAYDNSVV